MVMYGENFLPAIPDNLVVPALTETQIRIWQNENRNRGAVMGGGFFPGIAIMDNDMMLEWDDANGANDNDDNNDAPVQGPVQIRAVPR